MKSLKVSRLLAFGAVTVLGLSAFAGSKGEYINRANRAGAALLEIKKLPDSKAIPDKLLADAACVASIPHVVRAGFLVGYSQGYGLVSCKTSPTTWSEPSCIRIKTPSFGFQAGVDVTDIVLVFLDGTAINNLSQGTFALEGDASVSAGPVGRSSQAGTDSKGIFGGVSLNGAILTPDDTANRVVYGGNPSIKSLLTTEVVNGPSSARAFVRALP